MENQQKFDEFLPSDRLVLRTVFDNEIFDENFESGWGFACLVRGTQRTILFDTGADGAKVLANLARVEVHPATIDTVVISHDHNDHAGGLRELLAQDQHTEVVMLEQFSLKLRESTRALTADYREVCEPVRICEGVYTSGAMGGWRKEQSLVIRTDKGLVVITGCAHPHIIEILEHVREFFSGEELLLVMGGFHLEWSTKRTIKAIVADFKRLGVRYVAPSHCTGPKAQQIFKDAYGENYIPNGVGAKLCPGKLD